MFFSFQNDAIVEQLVALLIAVLTSILGGGGAVTPTPVATTTMTAAVVIVTESNSPNGYVVMDDASYSKAYSMVNALDTWVYDMSGGMGDVSVNVIEHSGDVALTSSSLGGERIDVHQFRGMYGLDGYDAVIVITDENADTIPDNTPAAAASYADTTNIWASTAPTGENNLVHEFGHGVETQLIARGYTQLPSCGQPSPLHCAEAYGYAWMADYGWMDDFYSGHINGSLGVNQYGWSLLA